MIRIETGRYIKLPYSDRVCQQCNSGEVENEYHFLMECEKFLSLRKKLFSKLASCLNICTTEQEKFKCLLQAKTFHIAFNVSNFIKDAFNLRK